MIEPTVDLEWIDQLAEGARQELRAMIEAALSKNKLADYKPYPKQLEFHRWGADLSIHERLFMAANQVGKTLSASMETAMHLTGQYPVGWPGAVFNHATKGWAASETGQSTRDSVQRLLLGEPGMWGTGSIPAASIVDIKRAKGGVPDQVESVYVRHEKGGVSRVTIKTYDQGRLRWQAETLDWVWFDEEPDEEIYIEGITRTNATEGIAYLTFTPLKGMSTVVKRFVIDKKPGTKVIKMTLMDALHYTPESIKATISKYKQHEREARIYGEPKLGSGAIFPVPREMISCSPFQIPKHWPRIAGIDFGWTHPTAGAWLAWDRDSDVLYVYDVYRVKEQTPAIHSVAFKGRGEWIPVAWPHDGENETAAAQDGKALREQYAGHGVKMLQHKATHPPQKGKEEGTGGTSVEAGLTEMLERMLSGRFKVFSHLNDWFEEYLMYHRDEGKVIKDDDDLMSATRYAVMMRRFAALPPAPLEVENVWYPKDEGAGY